MIEVKINNNLNVKCNGSGQECPLHKRAVTRSIQRAFIGSKAHRFVV
jgi:hypothetical protein